MVSAIRSNSKATAASKPKPSARFSSPASWNWPRAAARAPSGTWTTSSQPRRRSIFASGSTPRPAPARALADLDAGLRGPHASAPWLEDRMYALAQSLAGLRLQVRGEAQSFPGQRPTTRMELYRRLYRGRDFLLSCYDQPLTVSAAARVAALSPFHFQRMFKLAFGQTPMQLLQETRLEAARRLLAHTGDDVTAICFAVGFESLGSFSWLFRKRFGVSPRAFRAAGQNRSQNRRIEEVNASAIA